MMACIVKPISGTLLTIIKSCNTRGHEPGPIMGSNIFSQSQLSTFKYAPIQLKHTHPNLSWEKPNNKIFS